MVTILLLYKKLFSDNLKQAYREKMILEEEGIEKGDQREYKGFVYVFREKVPINKLKSLNNDIKSHFHQFSTHFNSSCSFLAEIIDKEVKLQYILSFTGEYIRQ